VASIDIDRPAAEVFDYVTDPSHFSDWQQGVVGGRLEAPDAPVVGTQCYDTRRIGQANRTSTSEITHREPPHRWSVRGIDGQVRATVDVTVDALEESNSHVTIAVDFKGRGIGKLIVPLVVRREARNEMPVNMTNLKQRLEAAP
jgi:uncharacterized protein YndB with AHSA1/START domain